MPGNTVILRDRIRVTRLLNSSTRAPVNPDMTPEQLIQVQSRARRMLAGLPLGKQDDNARVGDRRLDAMYRDRDQAVQAEAERVACGLRFRTAWAGRCAQWVVPVVELKTKPLEVCDLWPAPGYVVKAPLRVWLGRR